jgi:DNA/RNA endonuclease G (NUC1)
VYKSAWGLIYKLGVGACSDYNGSGYDRGHLAPAADHSHDLVKLKETFSLINISPQVCIHIM